MYILTSKYIYPRYPNRCLPAVCCMIRGIVSCTRSSHPHSCNIGAINKLHGSLRQLQAAVLTSLRVSSGRIKSCTLRASAPGNGVKPLENCASSSSRRCSGSAAAAISRAKATATPLSTGRVPASADGQESTYASGAKCAACDYVHEWSMLV